MTAQTLTQLIMEAEINQRIDISAYGSYYADVTFEQDTWETALHEDESTYTWTAHGQDQPWRSIFPLRSSQYIKYWKTLNGTKRNFLRHISWALNDKEQSQ